MGKALIILNTQAGLCPQGLHVPKNPFSRGLANMSIVILYDINSVCGSIEKPISTDQNTSIETEFCLNGMTKIIQILP